MNSTSETAEVSAQRVLIASFPDLHCPPVLPVRLYGGGRPVRFLHVQWCYAMSGRHTNLSAYLPEKSLLSSPVLILIHFEERCIQRKVVPD